MRSRPRRRSTWTAGRPTRSFLEKSLALDSEVVALTIEDRERILWALDDVRTDALAELRGVLLQEHEWRAKEGLD
jgi:hypothetical protein